MSGEAAKSKSNATRNIRVRVNTGVSNMHAIAWTDRGAHRVKSTSDVQRR